MNTPPYFPIPRRLEIGMSSPGIFVILDVEFGTGFVLEKTSTVNFKNGKADDNVAVQYSLFVVEASNIERNANGSNHHGNSMTELILALTPAMERLWQSCVDIEKTKRLLFDKTGDEESRAEIIDYLKESASNLWDELDDIAFCSRKIIQEVKRSNYLSSITTTMQSIFGKSRHDR